MLVCFIFLLFALNSMGSKSIVSAALPEYETGTGTNEIGGSSQIVPPVDPSMSDVVAFDISKGQWTDDAPGFIADLQAAGFTVATVNINEGIPSNVKKIIVMGLQSNYGLLSPYTAAEGTMLANWVSEGGELMLLSDHTAFTVDTRELFKAFGVTPQNNYVTDPTDYDAVDYWVIYQSDNFATHPILTGVTATEHLCGCSLEATSGIIITTDADATPSSVPVAVALEWGSGRVAMFGDTNWVQTFENGYSKVNNAQVAMQTIYWLNERPPAGVPEFDLGIPLMTAILTALYLGISKRYKK